MDSHVILPVIVCSICVVIEGKNNISQYKLFVVVLIGGMELKMEIYTRCLQKTI